ncbi:MAG: hypothetical protein LUF27_09725 [Lachnospiraceae bacterium]|nr:hypothetical protein [Lachnospiraceae bacterium]
MAIFGINRADDVMKEYDYEHWYISGHSLGGAMAASYAAENTDKLDGVILPAAYATKDLGDLAVLSIYGSNDGVLSVEKVELVAEAIQLKREVPERSVSQIIYILELEGRVEPGRLKRSTMQRYLYKAGFGERQMQMYKDARKSSSKRFCKPNRMMLVQANIKYGPKLPIEKKGAMVQTYLSLVMDDHSRYILQAQFYDNQEETVVEETFRKAILKHV